MDVALNFFESGKYEEAYQLWLVEYEQSKSNSAAANIAAALAQLGKYEEAKTWLLKLLPGASNQSNVINNLGLAYTDSDILKAIDCFVAVVEKHPTHAVAWANIMKLNMDLMRLDKAFEAQQKLLALGPTNHINLSKASDYEMMCGNLRVGFEQYESRLDVRGNHQAVMTRLENLGLVRTKHRSNLEGKKVLLVAEQGFGDSIMMMRFLDNLANVAATVTVFTIPPLFKLFESFGIRAIDTLDNLDGEEVYIYTMSLPNILLQLERPDLYNNGAYLKVEPSKQFQFILSQYDNRPKIGFTWQGNPKNLRDKIRSVPISEFTPLLLLDSVQFVNLQKDRACTLATVDLMHMCNSFYETAQLINELDEVIAVDTAICHLAGAMGVKTNLLNRFESEWRWGTATSDRKWYSTVTIHTQDIREHGKWNGVIFRLLLDLISRYGMSEASATKIANYYLNVDEAGKAAQIMNRIQAQ